MINTNAKKVITRNRPISIFSLKCKCVFVSFIKRFYKNRNDEFKMLYYARKINPKLFDKEIKNLNFDIKIKTNIYNKNIINNFLDQNNIKDKNLILLNPFSISAFYTLKLVDYLKLCQEIVSKFSDVCIIIPSYETVHKDFIQEFNMFFKQKPQKIYIFKNDDNILNICELIKRTKCVISPSTGVIHLASNLEKSSIGLFSEKDIIFWETFNKDYVLLNKTKEELSTYDILEIINEILLKLKRYL